MLPFFFFMGPFKNRVKLLKAFKLMYTDVCLNVLLGEFYSVEPVWDS